MTIANNVVAKSAAVVAGLALVFSSFAVAVPAKAATTAELEAQVAALLAQLQALQGGSSTSTGAAFTTDMTLGASGAEVTRLQNWLISKGHTIAAGATGYFGAQTAAAVAAYQTSKGITPAAGYFGPMTRAAVNAELGTGSTGGDDDDSDNDSGDLEGGAGAIEATDLLSDFNGEDVGEDEEDVEVAGLEIEVDDGSDIELTAVRLVFANVDGAATSDDLEDVATEISIMLDGEEVARVDADDFNEDNDYEKTVSLDGGAIIRAGEAGELVVAVSGVSNLDSADIDATWSVDFDEVRFRDADGATITETITEAARQFDFTTFAAAADISLELALTDDADDINDARVIDTDDSDETEGVEVLAFSLELEGDSEVTIDDLTFTATSTTDDLEDMISEIRLMQDGEEVASENVADGAGTTENITFDDLELVLDGEDTYDFTIEVDLLEDITNGSTLVVSMSEAQLEAADIEDESGEDLANGDITGDADGEAHGLYQSGIMVEFVSAEEDVTSPETGADRGTFEITFDVTAFDSDVYVDGTAPDASGTTESDLEVSGSGTLSAVITSPTGATLSGTQNADARFLVEEGDTERFTITANITATTDGFFSVAVGDIRYALSDVTGNLTYDFNLDDFKTDSIYLDTNS
ncbi:MAG TPA: peptidoglycan-binding protein [Candidatus Paceibacterota bacterium]|nr:peptidoglycan-binding protein [Candidatus Paceibacterota bacterium]